MAKIPCLNCHKDYCISKKQCPNCLTSNFFCHEDDVVVAKAVDVFVAKLNNQTPPQINTEGSSGERKEKLEELNRAKEPWYTGIGLKEK